jgi:hypothetical protein
MKFKLTNGTTVDVPDSAVDTAYRQLHPDAAVAAAGAAAAASTQPGQLDPNVVALRDTVTSLATQLADERTERRTDVARGVVDGMIRKGKALPAQRDKLVALYLSDRSTFDFVAGTLSAAPGTRVRGGDGDGDGDADGEFGSAEGGDEGDFAAGEYGELAPGESRSGGRGARRPAGGAIERWDREVARIAKDETKGDIQEAGKVLQLREPNLWHQRREEYAGQRLPRIVNRNNRHTAIS